MIGANMADHDLSRIVRKSTGDDFAGTKDNSSFTSSMIGGVIDSNWPAVN